MKSIRRYMTHSKSPARDGASIIIVNKMLIPTISSGLVWLVISISIGGLLSWFFIAEKLPRYALTPLIVKQKTPVVIVPPAIPARLCAKNIEKMLAKNIIHFTFNSAQLSQRGRVMVDKIIERLHGCEKATLLIEGHTDNIGHPDRNLRLSKQRAESVAKVIKDSDLKGFTIKTVGKGAEQPIASNNTKQGRYENRRIEIHWVKSF